MYEGSSRAANVKFMKNDIPGDFSDLEETEIMVMRTVRNREPGQELFVTHCCSLYICNGGHCSKSLKVDPVIIN